LLHIIARDETDPKESGNVKTEEQAGLSVASGLVPRDHMTLYLSRGSGTAIFRFECAPR
jgi:hypothetical protein